MRNTLFFEKVTKVRMVVGTLGIETNVSSRTNQWLATRVISFLRSLSFATAVMISFDNTPCPTN